MVTARAPLLWAVTALFAAGFAILGSSAASNSFAVDKSALALRGHATSAAWALTVSGFFATQLLIASAFVIYAWHAQRLRGEAVYALGLLLLVQGFVSLSKLWFHRLRPEAWLVRHETTYSYPSGHAATAVAFLGVLLMCVWLSSAAKSVRLAAAALAVVWTAGIAWSRLALGAHFATDVVGGLLLGAAWLCGTLPLYKRIALGFQRVQMPANHS